MCVVTARGPQESVTITRGPQAWVVPARGPRKEGTFIPRREAFVASSSGPGTLTHPPLSPFRFITDFFFF